ncbi:MAG: DUF3014 domain-containing protein [Thiogranum sp.]|nr:DUF3014 domain-containing protein [Thiogranum sp.]
MNKPLTLIVLLVLGAGAAGAFYYWQYTTDVQQPLVLETPPEPLPLPGEEPMEPIIHPVPEIPVEETEATAEMVPPEESAEAQPPVVVEPDLPGQEPPTPEVETAKPLPPLDASDPEIVSSLTGVIERNTLETLFNLDGIIRRLVMTADNLPRDKLSMRYAINHPTAGRFRVLGEEDDDTLILDPTNFSRYTPFVRVAEALDTTEIVALYVRMYPLFQQAYQELGYPSAYFNDRLIAVIDHLLEAPEVTGEIRLKRPHVLYRFADPELEALSAGQKLLIRVGPANAARLKTKLLELRKVLATGER